MTTRHVPVMTDEVLRYLLHDASQTVVDATLGSGGHAEAILSARDAVTVIGLDRDPIALDVASQRLSRFAGRFHPIRAHFADLASVLETLGPVDGVLADLGVSSGQLDDPGRGFSYRLDGPLDMRMDAEGETAEGLIARSDVETIAGILRRYGEVRRPKRLAAAIKCASDSGDLGRTAQLRQTVVSAVGGAASPSLLGRVFQAFRIALNHELDELDTFLSAAVEVVVPGGRVVVISYHSLEDRAVKNFFRLGSAGCVCPPEAPVCSCDHVPVLEVLTRRVVTPAEDEVERNTRARSARLRSAKVLDTGGRR